MWHQIYHLIQIFLWVPPRFNGWIIMAYKFIFNNSNSRQFISRFCRLQGCHLPLQWLSVLNITAAGVFIYLFMIWFLPLPHLWRSKAGYFPSSLWIVKGCHDSPSPGPWSVTQGPMVLNKKPCLPESGKALYESWAFLWEAFSVSEWQAWMESYQGLWASEDPSSLIFGQKRGTTRNKCKCLGLHLPMQN